MSQIQKLLRRAQPGTTAAVRRHIRRAEQIADTVAAYWGVDGPWQWKVKHIRWYLTEACAGMSTKTRYDHWRTLRATIAAMGRLADWEPHLRGPWQHRAGRPGRQPGGRPAKLANRARQ